MLKRIFATALVVVCCAFTQASKSQTQDIAKPTIMDYPKVFLGREPIKLKDMGGYKLQVKNASKQTITKFLLYFVASQKGGTLHGPGAHRHTFPVYWGYETPDMLPPGESVDVSLAEGIKAFTSDPAADPNNTEVWAFEVRFEDSSKMWRMGESLKRARNNKWEQDYSLNPRPAKFPKRNGFVAQGDGRCWSYDMASDWPQVVCSGECSACKFEVPQLKLFYGGYQLVQTCQYCINQFRTTCQKANGQACTVANINDIDVSNPCTY